MEEPFIKFARQLISDAGEDADISLTGEGVIAATHLPKHSGLQTLCQVA